MAKNPPAFAGDTGDSGSGSSPGQEDPLKEERATHSTVLAWRSSWTEEPGGLQSTGSKRVRHDLARVHAHTHTHTHTHKEDTRFDTSLYTVHPRNKMTWCPEVGSMDQQSGMTSCIAPPSWGKQPTCVWYPEAVQRKLLDASGGHCSALIHSLATTQHSPHSLSASSPISASSHQHHHCHPW